MFEKYRVVRSDVTSESMTSVQNPSRRLIGYLRRRKFILGLCIILPIGLHFIQTGFFLLNHFTANEDRNYLIQLDMISWRELGPNQDKIPRHIHQIWLSTDTNEPMYENFRQASNACLSLHVDYNYTLWTDEKITDLLRSHYAWFLPIYRNYRYDMQRIDAMKYVLLFHFGGIYIDLDIKCNVQDLLTAMIPVEKRKNEPEIIFHMGTEGISANTDILAAKRFHPFFKLALSQLESANRWFYLYHLTIILSAGPTFLYGIYRQFPCKEHFYYIPNHLLYGKLIEGVGGGTWYGKDSVILFQVMNNRFRSILILVIGIGLVYLVYKFLKRKRAC